VKTRLEAKYIAVVRNHENEYSGEQSRVYLINRIL